MCDNVFKNEEEEKRREEFTRLFALLASEITRKSLPAKRTPKKVVGK